MEKQPIDNFAKAVSAVLASKDPSEIHLRYYENVAHEIQLLTGYDLSQLISLLKMGYTLQPPK